MHTHTQMVQARDQQLNLYQNETKLEQVQVRFPNDDLHLTESIEVIEVTCIHIFNSHTYSAPQAAVCAHEYIHDYFHCFAF